MADVAGQRERVVGARDAEELVEADDRDQQQDDEVDPAPGDDHQHGAGAEQRADDDARAQHQRAP